MLTASASNAVDHGFLELTHVGLRAIQLASTAGQLRRAVESLRQLPGVSLPLRELPRDEGLLVAATEQRELARLHDVDLDTGLANRRRFGRALRETTAHSEPDFGGIALIFVRLTAASELQRLVRAAHVCATMLRTGDLAARLGSRSLGVLLSDISRPSALAVAARLVTDLRGLRPSLVAPDVTIRVFTRDRSSASKT